MVFIQLICDFTEKKICTKLIFYTSLAIFSREWAQQPFFSSQVPSPVERKYSSPHPSP